MEPTGNFGRIGQCRSWWVGCTSTLNSTLRPDESLFARVLVTALMLDDQTAWVAVPGELFIAHQLDLRQRAGIAHPFLLGLAYSGR